MKRLLVLALFLFIVPIVNAQIPLGGVTVAGGGGGGPTTPTFYSTAQYTFAVSGGTTSSCAPTACQTGAGNSGQIIVNLPGAGASVPSATILFASFCEHSGVLGATTPSGWTLVQSLTVGTTDECFIYDKTFASSTSPPASLTIAISDTEPARFALAWGYDGCGAGCSVDGTPQTITSTTSSASLAMASITTTGVNEVVDWIGYVNGDIGAGSVTVTQGTNEVAITRSVSAAAGYAAAVDKSFPTAGASGTNTLSWPAARTAQEAITIAVKGS